MPSFYMCTEPTYSGESEEQYRARISDIAASKRVSEERQWERKKVGRDK